MNNKEQETTNEITLAPAVKSGLMRFDEFDHFFDDFISRRWPRLVDWSMPVAFENGVPKVDIIDHDTEIEVQAALPGINKEDLEISIANQSITIRASSKSEKKEEKTGKYFRREISRGEFQRTLSLPENVDRDNAKASFKDGILAVTIPKTEKSQRKNIEIK